MSRNTDLSSLLNGQRSFFATDVTRPLSFRLDGLRKLRSAIETNESKLLAALFADLHKPVYEALASEICLVLSEIDHAIARLSKWIKPQRRRTPCITWPSRGSIVADPRGVALIMGAWNYPVQLILMPLVGAIAAGCCAILKPSEIAPHTAAVLADLIGDTFSSEYIAVVNGDRSVSESLLKERFDSIFFTGSITAGRAVMNAAAEHLTPVTLELGGKCPCIVCEDAPVALTARRLIWGKMLNAGQSCVAPDFVLVDRRISEDLIAAMKIAILDFFGADPKLSPDYGRIINRHRFDQLVSCLEAATIVTGGQTDAELLYIAPTILTNVSATSQIMLNEILGPIMPIIEFDNIDQAISFLKPMPSPLAAYLFTNDRLIQNRCVGVISCGGVCINDAIVHLFGKNLPFGGVGASGIGSYHGKASFDNFSHFKTVLRCSSSVDFRYRYPPQKLPLAWFKRILRVLLQH